MTAPELKPCPFCGAVDPEWLASHVVCDCGATGPRQDVDREYQADAMRALTDWNRRADLAHVQPARVQPDPRDEVIARLVEALKMMQSTYPYNPPCYGWQEQVEAHKTARAALAAAKAVQHG